MSSLVNMLEVLSDEDIQWVLSVGVEKAVEQKEIIIQAGDYIENLYIVLEGQLAVYITSAGDARVSTICPGEVMGEMSYLEYKPTSAYVIAETDAVLLAIPRDMLDARVQEDPEFGKRLYRGIAISISNRLRMTLKRVDHMLKVLESAKAWTKDGPC
ncbi:MAG: cyclic nucleotide-binding domain-containing protein [Candidatus Magnetoovum sp. WYHC-5]|nr:cyclic nucleotide-binding domain-containing protein [Candidatus Magnetoovum sp. WYHC-5]